MELTENKNKEKKNKENKEAILCPICSKNLTGFSENVIQSHVNRCLDGPTLIKKQTSVNNKIQRSITSYMNVSSTTQSSICSYFKNPSTNSKYFDKPEKINKKNTLNKTHSLTEEVTLGNENNLKIAKKSKSFNDSLNEITNEENKINSSPLNNSNSLIKKFSKNSTKINKYNKNDDEDVFIEDLYFENEIKTIGKSNKNLLNDSFLNNKKCDNNSSNNNNNNNNKTNYNDFSINLKQFNNENFGINNSNQNSKISAIDEENNMKNNINDKNDKNEYTNIIDLKEEKDIQEERRISNIPFAFEDIEDNFNNEIDKNVLINTNNEHDINNNNNNNNNNINNNKYNNNNNNNNNNSNCSNIDGISSISSSSNNNSNSNNSNNSSIIDSSSNDNSFSNDNSKNEEMKTHFDNNGENVASPPMNNNDDALFDDLDININESDIQLEKLMIDNQENGSNGNNLEEKSEKVKKRKRKEKEKKSKEKETKPKIPKKRKYCPNYKKVLNTSFVVDGFSYGKIENCTAYFLSHFHSDHYGGITAKYDYGPIYCSKVTSNLLIELLKVDEQYVHPLELNKEYIIDGVKVTLIDANHCPGAVLFLFNVPIGNNKYFNALHTGDFRANIDQLMNPSIQKLKDSFLDVLYLDTTYLQPEHIFPSQEIVINSVLDVLKNIVFEGKTIKEYNNLEKINQIKNDYQGGLLRFFKTEKGELNDINGNENENENAKLVNINNIKYNHRRVLVLVGTYLIGKEKVFLGIAKFLKSKIYASSRKKKILECLNDETISSLLTSNPDEACVHVLDMGQLSIDKVNNYYNNYSNKYDMVIAFRPTGWVFKPKRVNKRQLIPDSKKILEQLNNLKLKPTYYNRNISIWGIPYSEHSSFVELENFIRVLSSIAPIRDIQPTVNVKNFYSQSEESKKYWHWFDSWRQNPLNIF